MTPNIDIVKRLNQACLSKDFDTVKSLLHPNYSLKDPMMSFNSPDEFIAFMKECPFECKMENVSFIAEGDKVVQMLDAVMTAPIAFRFRMCDVLTLENGKVRSEEVFYDPTQIPEEAKTLNQKTAKKQAAA
jgi:ketosteroid isomerase-like protein